MTPSDENLPQETPGELELDADKPGGPLDGGGGESNEPLPASLPIPSRGIQREEAVRATLTRFLPSSILSLGIGFLLLEVPVGAETLEFIVGTLLLSGATTIGYGLGLEGLRRWLYENANVAGRRSVVAGLLSPLAVFIGAVLFQGLGTIGGGLLFLLVGIVMALVMFFPWLTPDADADYSTSDGPVDSSDQGLLLPDQTATET
jgi:hypothetical protein